MGDEPTGWNPTPEQRAEYLRRETEMVAEKLRRRIHPSTMLHTSETIERARKLIIATDTADKELR